MWMHQQQVRPNVSAYRLLSLPNHCADHGTIWLRVHQAQGSILFLTLSDILIPQIFDVLSRMLCKLLLSFIRNSCKYLDFSSFIIQKLSMALGITTLPRYNENRGTSFLFSKHIQTAWLLLY